MNAKTSVFFICVETVIYLLQYDFNDCIFNTYKAVLTFKRIKSESDLKVGHNFKLMKPQVSDIHKNNINTIVLIHYQVIK